jgi:hypothetical protein
MDWLRTNEAAKRWPPAAEEGGESGAKPEVSLLLDIVGHAVERHGECLPASGPMMKGMD